MGGLAPLGDGPIHDAVVFVFASTLKLKTQALCETAAQEIGHAYGLDHVMVCKDPMTYLTGCGAKTFQDVDAPCGERDARACADGGATQNSHQHLLDVLGARPLDPETPVSLAPKAGPRPETDTLAATWGPDANGRAAAC